MTKGRDILYCPNCGKLIHSNVKFCPYCGYRIDNDLNNDNHLNGARNTYSKSSQKGIGIIIAVIIVIILIIFAGSMFKNYEKNHTIPSNFIDQTYDFNTNNNGNMKVLTHKHSVTCIMDNGTENQNYKITSTKESDNNNTITMYVSGENSDDPLKVIKIFNDGQRIIYSSHLGSGRFFNNDQHIGKY